MKVFKFNGWEVRVSREVVGMLRESRNKRLPKGVKGKGTTHLRIRVSPTGQLVSAQITKSSGVAAFDQAALSAVKRSGRFAKAPKGLTKASYSFRFSIKFKR